MVLKQIAEIKRLRLFSANNYFREFYV